MPRRTPRYLALCLVPISAQAAHKETTMVPMRDGVHLATDAYIPDSGSGPTVLIRTPYGKGNLDDPFPSILCDDLGFTLVIQDMRGQGDSEGVDQVFYTDGWGELQDGWDTDEWIVNQPWSTGEIGQMGVSAMGIAANMNAGALHPALKTIHTGVASTDLYPQTAYQGGSFREALVVDWLEGQGASHMIPVYQEHPWDDAFWAELDINARWGAEVSIPIFHYGGFHDIFAEGTISGFEAMQDKMGRGDAGEQRLMVGPWTHVDAGAFWTRQGELDYPTESILPLGDASPISWFNKHLQGVRRPLQGWDPYPVRIWVMGDPEAERSEGNFWAWAKGWPVDATATHMYLQAGGGLSRSKPVGDAAPAAFVADPQDPGPTIGGRELSLPAGPRDQRPLLERDDVLVFETAPLTEAYRVVGAVSAALYLASDAPDTDLVVRLTDVYPDGRSMLVLDGIQRARSRNGATQADETFLTPGRVTRIDVELGSTAQVFDVGHRIQVLISSSNNRRFLVGGNTDLPFWEEGEGQVAHNEIHLDETYASELILPVPRRGALRHFPEPVQPSREDEARALRRYDAGLPLSALDRDALRQAADRALLMMMYGAVVDAYRL